MIKVDKEGIPRIVQKVKYLSSSYLFEITLFNARKYFIEPPTLIRYPPSFWQDTGASNEQMEDAYIAAENLGMRYD